VGIRDSRLSSKLRLAPTRYEPVAPIAAGGMAEVWRAFAVFDSGDRHPVAIKRVLPQLGADPLYRRMFEDEARLGMLLRHPNIVRVYDARDVGGALIMIMELVDGTTLKALLDLAIERAAAGPADRPGGLPVAASLFVARGLCEGLAYAHVAEDEHGRHLGIIHRDVSPHNLLLGKDGAVKLTDFGLADAATHTAATAPGGMVGGKLGYLAPEVIAQTTATPRIDVFAAGIVLWEMLTGRRLFQAASDVETVRAVARCEVPPPSALRPGLPPSVDGVVLRALAADPARRTPSAHAMVEELDEALRDVDPGVSAKDVALMVGLFLAQRRARPPATSSIVAGMLAEELAQFVAAADADPGAAPLDPSEFDWGPTVRR
jgi:serine/threonine-protein kinase